MFVIEFDAYTDGDWGFERKITEKLSKHISRYFEQDYYEYTEVDVEDYYRYKFRRTFNNNELDDALEFMTALKEALGGREYYEKRVKGNFDVIINGIKEAILRKSANNPDDKVFYTTSWITGEDEYTGLCQFDFDGNSDGEIVAYYNNKYVKKIKHIEYE